MTNNQNQESTAKSIHAVMDLYPVGATGGSIHDATDDDQLSPASPQEADQTAAPPRSGQAPPRSGQAAPDAGQTAAPPQAGQTAAPPQGAPDRNR